MRISWVKTKILRFARGTVHRACCVAVGTGELIQVVDVFPYLGALVVFDEIFKKDVDRCLELG